MNFPTGRRSTQTWGLSVFAACDVSCAEIAFLAKTVLLLPFPKVFDSCGSFARLSRGFRGNLSGFFDFPLKHLLFSAAAAAAAAAVAAAAAPAGGLVCCGCLHKSMVAYIHNT